MAPILYSLKVSPPVRSVLLTAKAINLELELKNVDLFKYEHIKPDFIKINPQHTVPTLDDNGYIVWDSHAINAYLVSKYAKDDFLYPKDLEKRAIIDQRLHFSSGILFPKVRSIFVPILYYDEYFISEENLEAMHQIYSLVNTFLKNQMYLAGNHLTIADFCAVSSLSTVVPVVCFAPEKYPDLSRWLDTMKMLPYYHEANGYHAEIISKKANELLGK